MLLVCLMTVSIALAEGSTDRVKYIAGDETLNQSFEKSYAEGQYKCGVDINAGEYILIATEEDAYFAVSSDANGIDIIFNGIFDTNSIVTIQLGEYLRLDDCFAVSADEFYSKYFMDHSVAGTMLKVGAEYDILPGEYKLSATEDGAYYAIYDSSI